MDPTQLPALIERSAAEPTLEFFLAQIRNANTRVAYWYATTDFLRWCQMRGCSDLATVRPLHVAGYIEWITRDKSASTAKQRLAAIRSFFSWLVTSQVIARNPAASVRGPPFSRRVGATPVLSAGEMKALFQSLETDTLIGLRDRALIATMFYAFARVGAATGMKVGDVFPQKQRLWLRLKEKGGKEHEMPCHHRLEQCIHEYVGKAELRDGPLFRAFHKGTMLPNALRPANAYAMVRRRAKSAGLATKIGNHTFRASGITIYLQNGGTLELAARMANHASTRTTQLYDRRADEITQSEVERILL
jgi:site-specific recombinase XerD